MANDGDPKISAEDVDNQKSLNQEQEKSLEINKDIAKILKQTFQTEEDRIKEAEKLNKLLLMLLSLFYFY